MVFVKNIRADERTSALAQQLPNYENFFNTGGLCRAVVARRDECVGRGELLAHASSESQEQHPGEMKGKQFCQRILL